MKPAKPKPHTRLVRVFFRLNKTKRDEIMQTPDKEKAASGVQPRAASKTISSCHSIMIVRVKTLNDKRYGKRMVLIAAKHIHREIQAEFGSDGHIDVTRTPENYIVIGADTAAGVAEYERELLADAEFPRPLRKNAVRAVELIFSLPPDSGIDHREFFPEATEWARKFYSVPVLSSVVHLDEAAPHCHVLLLPLVDGEMQGSALVGNRARLLAMQSDFFEQVAKRYGLARQTPQKRPSAAVRHDVAGKSLAQLRSNHGLLDEPSVKDALLELFAANPATIAAALGIDMPEPKKPKTRTVTEIFTKNCPEKKTKPIGNGRPNTIGKQPEKHQTLCSVGNGFTKPVISPTEPEQTAHSDDDQPDDYQRTRDDEQEAGCWDSETGEFIRHAVMSRSQSPAIERTRHQIAALQAAKGVH